MEIRRRVKPKITVEDNIGGEIVSSLRHESVDGEIFGMASGSDNHNRIAGNLYALILTKLGSSNCEAFYGDINVRASATAYYYPDVDFL